MVSTWLSWFFGGHQQGQPANAVLHYVRRQPYSNINNMGMIIVPINTNSGRDDDGGSIMLCAIIGIILIQGEPVANA